MAKEHESYIKSCIFKTRDGEVDPLFERPAGVDGLFIVRLDGYAIVPVEEYRLLIRITRWLKALMFWR